MSVFSSSLVTCAPELCMPPLTSNMLFEYISGPVIQPVYALSPPPLFIATRLSNPRKRSWIIISRLSTRQIWREFVSSEKFSPIYVSLLEKKIKIVRFNLIVSRIRSIIEYRDIFICNGWRYIHIFVDIINGHACYVIDRNRNF